MGVLSAAYNIHMSGIRSAIIGSLLSFMLLAPSVALAADTNFFGPIWPPNGTCSCPGSAPDWGCVLEIGQNVLNVGVSIAFVAATFYIIYAGFMYITAAFTGNSPGRLQVARTQLTNVLFGILVVLSAWILVDFTMKLLYDPQVAFSGKAFGPWTSILDANQANFCIAPNESGGLISGSLNIALGTGGSSGGGNGTGSSGSSAGRCEVQSKGPCAEVNFRGLFGARASQASQICFAESSANPRAVGDKTTEGRPVSIGLFQINLTQHDIGGKKCTKAFDSKFTGSHRNVKVINEELYKDCVAIAMNPSRNIEYAADLYKRSGNSWRQWSTGKKCALP